MTDSANAPTAKKPQKVKSAKPGSVEDLLHQKRLLSMAPVTDPAVHAQIESLRIRIEALRAKGK